MSHGRLWVRLKLHEFFQAASLLIHLLAISICPNLNRPKKILFISLSSFLLEHYSIRDSVFEGCNKAVCKRGS
jgi:hypothetical protein